jgi:hypothetical protein
MRPAIARGLRCIADAGQAPPPVRLRLLAGMVERLAIDGRTDPEQATLGKLLIGAQLRRLSRELDR